MYSDSGGGALKCGVAGGVGRCGRSGMTRRSLTVVPAGPVMRSSRRRQALPRWLMACSSARRRVRRRFLPQFGEPEQRVVAEAAVTALFACDLAVPFALDDDRLRVVGAAHQRQHADETCARRSALAGKIGAAVFRCCVRRTSGRRRRSAPSGRRGRRPAPSTHRPESSASAGRPVAGGVARLAARVLDEGDVGLVGFGHIGVTSDWGGAGRCRAAPAGPEFAQLAGIVGSDDQLLHRAKRPMRRAASRSAARCRSWPVPAAHPFRRG